jgi:Tfp pilus assembly protein PilX
MKFQHNHPQFFLLLMLVRLRHKRDRYEYDQPGGYTLVITLAVLLILSVLLLTYAITSKVDNASSNASAKGTTGFYAAEAGLNLRAKEVYDRFVDYNRPSGTSPANWKACLDPTAFKGTGDFQCQTNTDISTQPVTTYIEDETGSVPKTVVIPAGENNEGLTAQEYRYNVISIAQDSQSKPSAIVGLKFKSRLIPLFQFAAFYDQDMDINLPPVMTLSGPVHSNNDLYLNASGTLRIKGQLTTANKLYRGLKYKNECSGDVKVDDATPAPRNVACAGGRTEFKAIAPWNGKIRVGVQTLKPPPPGDFDATSGRLYWDSADLRLVLDLTNPTAPALQIRSAGGNILSSETTDLLNSNACAPSQTLITSATTNTLTVTPGTAVSFTPNSNLTVGADPHLYFVQSVSGDVITIKGSLNPNFSTVAAGTVVRKPIVSFSDKTFRNYREKKGLSGPDKFTPIQMLNVDMRGLLGCAKNLMGKPLNEDSEGGLVWFFTVKGPDSGAIDNDYGIRVYNGQDLVTPINSETPQGLSIISDQAVYVRGDYNCKAACTASTFESSANTGQRIPAAVMADSINVLSNLWPLDDLTSINLKDRVPSETTINAAFLAGIDITGGKNRDNQDLDDGTGGGLNNYPRFHEYWKDFKFNYLGSLVSLSAPRRVNGPFCGSGGLNSDGVTYTTGTNSSCNIYYPPTRNWSYDTQFNNAANLPPLTPRVVSLKQELFSRNFDQALIPSFSPWAILSPQRLFSVLGALLGALSQSHS